MRFVSDFRTMYYACRTDYPCEGCEQPRWMATKNAVRWAMRQRRRRHWRDSRRCWR